MAKQTLNDVFEPTHFSEGEFGISSKFGGSKFKSKNFPEKSYMLVAWRSPYATAKANAMLEKDLLAAYKKYYFRTIVENFGVFWG